MEDDKDIIKDVTFTVNVQVSLEFLKNYDVEELENYLITILENGFNKFVNSETNKKINGESNGNPIGIINKQEME